jgi:hypothetical protein
MGMVQKLVTEDSFVNGTLVRAGHLATFDEEQLTGKEKHIKDVDGFEPAIVQVAPIGPTGPNPKLPQQIPPDAIQSASGEYQLPGKTLVAEVTRPQEERIDQAGLGDDNAEAKVTDTLADLMSDNATGEAGGGKGSTSGNADDALVDGTVSEVTANLGGQTDEQLAKMKAAENDREKPRTGVISAIDAELEKRKAAKS